MVHPPQFRSISRRTAAGADSNASPPRRARARRRRAAKRGWIAFAAILTVALAGCRRGADPPPVILGQVVSLTGADKYAGAQAKRGLLLAVKEQNDQAREKSARPLRVYITDPQNKVTAFEGAAVRVVALNKAVAIFGGNTVEEVLRLDRARVPVLTPLGYRTQAMSEQVFCTGLSPSYRGQVLARFALELAPAGPFAVVLEEQYDEAAILADAFTREIAHLSEKTAKQALRPVGWSFGKETKPAELAGKVVKDKPLVTLFAGQPRDLLAFKAAFKQPGATLLSGGSEGNVKALLDAREGEGVFVTTAFVADIEVPRAKEFVAEFHKAYDEKPDVSKPDVNAALAYDAVRLFDEAFKRCEGAATPERFREKLLDIKDFPGVTGPLAFGKDGRLRRAAFIAQVERGELKVKKHYGPETP